MMCPSCTTEAMESKRVSKGQHRCFKIHLCRRCKGAWIDRRQLELMLEQIPQNDLAGLDRALTTWNGQFWRATTKPIPKDESPK